MTVKTLTSSPSLLPLYGKAAVTGPLHRGDALPDSVYSLGDRSIDAAHLRQYQQVCGFRVTDELPPTYLHVLAFPLSVALMTEQAFPFPLVGLVHVNNAITVHRPVTSAESYSFTVRAADLRPHPAGRQLDLIAEATVEGEIVWSGRSTYLRRGKPSGEKPAKPADDKKPREQASLRAAASTIRVPGDIGRKYGAVSGDRNPIHIHALTARAFGFPSAIAHGMWLKARTLAALEGRLPDAFSVDVAFKTPVLLPSTVVLTAEAVADGWALDVRNARTGKPHLTGRVAKV
jgi:acyl dehydratase